MSHCNKKIGTPSQRHLRANVHLAQFTYVIVPTKITLPLQNPLSISTTITAVLHMKKGLFHLLNLQ